MKYKSDSGPINCQPALQEVKLKLWNVQIII